VFGELPFELPLECTVQVPSHRVADLVCSLWHPLSDSASKRFAWLSFHQGLLRHTYTYT
jgi:hypothetical protein